MKGSRRTDRSRQLDLFCPLVSIEVRPQQSLPSAAGVNNTGLWSEGVFQLSSTLLRLLSTIRSCDVCGGTKAGGGGIVRGIFVLELQRWGFGGGGICRTSKCHTFSGKWAFWPKYFLHAVLYPAVVRSKWGVEVGRAVLAPPPPMVVVVVDLFVWNGTIGATTTEIEWSVWNRRKENSTKLMCQIANIERGSARLWAPVVVLPVVDGY